MAERHSVPAATRTTASGSSFYPAMRLLPKAERQAIYAIYAFSHAVDDIADADRRSRSARKEDLAEWRHAIVALYDGGRDFSRAEFLLPAVRQFGLRKEDFLAVIDGMEMDVAADIRAPDLSILDLYCDRVASAVGRLAIKIFGMDEAPGFALAHHLGRALQMTNILRDLDEDAQAGRLYLPREYLLAAGITTNDPQVAIFDPAIGRACRELAAKAREHYDRASTILAARPRGLLRTPRLMAAVYLEILKRMERAGWAPPRRRVRLSRLQLLQFALSVGLSP